MSKALWPAMSGAIARDHEVEVIANNLANANTAGFKKDQVNFKEYLVQNEKAADLNVDIPRSPIKDKDLYPLDGRDQSFVIVNGTHTQFSQGGMKVTDNPLDLAISGEGFFEVNTPSGVRYTRAGNFKLSADGKLVTTEGYPVLAETGGRAGGDARAREIQLQDRQGNVHINESGDIYMGEGLVAKLSVVTFPNKNLIQKAGSLLFENKKPDQNEPVTISQAGLGTTLKQGVIETSNVNPVEEISNLIRANRMFEQDLKALKTVNEMMQKEVNDIGKF